MRIADLRDSPDDRGSSIAPLSPELFAACGEPSQMRMIGRAPALTLLLFVALLGTEHPALTPQVSAAELPYLETFESPNGSPWPAPWFIGGQHVTVADIQDERARLNGDPAFVARMILPDFEEIDVEVLVTFEFEDVANQGIGFYVRQNGGTLREYLPHGQGYAMFLKGDWFWPEDLGIWREIDGVETQFATGYDPIAGGLQDGVRYRLRFRVTQMDAATTLLQARVWPENGAEPTAWTVETTDTRAEYRAPRVASPQTSTISPAFPTSFWTICRSCRPATHPPSQSSSRKNPWK